MNKGVRVWTCDGCGKRETWRKGWMWWPGVVSPRDPKQPAVACSDACEDLVLDPDCGGARDDQDVGGA